MLHDKRRLLLIAGPCSLESESNCRTVATELKALAAKYPELNIIFKGSYDKANRTSLSGDRGPGMQAGLELLAMVKKDFGFNVLTDIHGPDQCEAVGKVVDVLQVPAKCFGFCFGVFVIGYIIGATSGGKLSKRLTASQLVGLGSLIALLSALALVAINLIAPASVWTVLAPLLPYMIGVGMTLPAAQAGAIGPFPRSAGAASALLGFVQMAVAAAIGAVLGVIGSPSPMPMTLMIAGTGVAQIACYWFVIRKAPAA